MTKDEAREAAWMKWMMGSRLAMILRHRTSDSANPDFTEGFDAGYDFAKSEDRWHVIERDGLPMGEMEYHITTVDGELGICHRSPESDSDSDYWRTFIIAWRPLPEPYNEDARIEAEAMADWEAIQREQSTNR